MSTLCETIYATGLTLSGPLAGAGGAELLDTVPDSDGTFLLRSETTAESAKRFTVKWVDEPNTYPRQHQGRRRRSLP